LGAQTKRISEYFGGIVGFESHRDGTRWYVVDSMAGIVAEAFTLSGLLFPEGETERATRAEFERRRRARLDALNQKRKQRRMLPQRDLFKDGA
jgi:hypothetical protein